MNKSEGMCYATAKEGVDGFDKLCVKKTNRWQHKEVLFDSQRVL